MKKFFSGLIVLAFLVVFAGLAFAEKEEEGYDFVLVNNYGIAISEMYLTSAARPYWHLLQDKVKLKNGSIKSGESMEVKLPIKATSAKHVSKTKRRYWHLMVVFSNGRKGRWVDLDLANVNKIEITKKNGEPFLTRYVP